jgi:hypothetical protein
MVRKAGLEPARVLPTTPSRWRVYQIPPLPHNITLFPPDLPPQGGGKEGGLPHIQSLHLHIAPSTGFPSKASGVIDRAGSPCSSPSHQGRESTWGGRGEGTSSNHFVPVSAGAGAPAGGAAPVGGAAGAELSVCWGTSPGVTPFITDEEVPLPEIRASPREVNMNITAAATVILCRKDAAPELPKTVWLEPPKAAPMLAPFPFWSKTIMMRAMQTAIWTRTMISFIRVYLIQIPKNKNKG